MSDLTTAWHHNSGGPARVWYQSFVDPQKQPQYIDRLPDCLTAYAEPSVSFEVHGVSPPDRYLSALSEFRCADQAIRHATQAEQQGYDAFVIGHFQEPGLVECRSAVEIPVVGLVTINPAFIPWHRDQIARLGLGQRAVGVRAIDTQVASYTQAFEDDHVDQQVKDEFCQQALPLVEAGAEVIIPSGGLPMLLLAREPNVTVGGATVPNGIAVVTAMTEVALKLRRLTGVAASRQGTSAKAPPEAIQEFLATR